MTSSLHLAMELEGEVWDLRKGKSISRVLVVIMIPSLFYVWDE